MADDRTASGEGEGSSGPSPPDSFWKRSKRALGGKNFTFLQHVPKGSEDAPPGDQEPDAKAAHSRRREQVRRAQRNHRERKERYIKTLEREVLRLRDEEAAIAEQSKNMRVEVDILKELLASHGIPLPSRKLGNPDATISVFGLPGGDQGLHVDMPSPDFLNAQAGFSSPSAHSGHGLSGSETTPTADRQASNYHTNSSPEKDLPSIPSPEGPGTTPRPGRHAQQPEMTTAQIGIDFVLTLEQPCLGHTRPADPSLEGAPSGHALTAQAMLLTRAPQTLSVDAQWTMPAIEIERLLELSAGLNLVGELTPVQAWNRIKSYPGVRQHADARQRLETLKQRLKAEVHCYEFGAVVDEIIFETYLREAFGGTRH